MTPRKNMRVRGPDGRFRTPFPFFELPAELRTQIYSLVLCATNNRLGSVHNVRSRSGGNPLDKEVVRKRLRFNVSLLCTCRLILNEARPILYQLNNIHFAIKAVKGVTQNRYTAALSFQNTFTQDNGSFRNARYMRSISVLFRSDIEVHNFAVSRLGDAMLAAMLDLCSTDIFPVLRKLEVYVQPGGAFVQADCTETPVLQHLSLPTALYPPPQTVQALQNFITLPRRPQLQLIRLGPGCTHCRTKEDDNWQAFLLAIAPAAQWTIRSLKGRTFDSANYPKIPSGSAVNPARILNVEPILWVEHTDPLAVSSKAEIERLGSTGGIFGGMLFRFAVADYVYEVVD